MREPKVKETGKRFWEVARRALPWVGLVALAVLIVSLLITLASLWLRAEGRARDAELANIRLEGEATELRRRSTALEAALRECLQRVDGAAAVASERALQFYVTDTEGHPVVGAAVSALRTRERVVTRESGLTDRLILRVGDKVAVEREGFESRKLAVGESELEGLVVDVELRR